VRQHVERAEVGLDALDHPADLVVLRQVRSYRGTVAAVLALSASTRAKPVGAGATAL
jgi:hypothetical protein